MKKIAAYYVMDLILNPSEQQLPITTRRKCHHCDSYLGSADPGLVCSTCNYIAQTCKKFR